MATTNSNPERRLSYGLSYGFVGGPLHARKFKHLMNLAGYDHQLNLPQADIIIAHSAGCWLIPNGCQPKLVIYVGMPLAQLSPVQSLLMANRMALKNNDLGRTLITKTKTAYYSLRQPRRNVNIIRMSKTARPVILKNVPAIFIANKNDPWPQADQLQKYIDDHAWAFIGLPGTHDDVWEHPERYLEIINYYARLLV
jgi:hypothetical protein